MGRIVDNTEDGTNQPILGLDHTNGCRRWLRLDW